MRGLALAEEQRAVGAHHVVERAVVAAGRLAVGEEHPVPVGVHEVGLEVVVDVAAVGGNRTATDGHARGRRLILHHPHDLVGVVDGLLDEAVTRQPREVVPVAHLPLDVAHAGRTRALGRHRLDRVGVVGRVVRHEPAERAAVHLLHRGRDHVVVAPAEPGDERLALGLLGLVRLDHRADARAVGRRRLLAEDVLVGIDRRLEVRRTEPRRRGEQHDVDVAVDDLLERIEAVDLVVDLDLAAELLAAGEARHGLAHDGLIDVADGRQDGVLVGAERLCGGPAATAARTDETDLEGIGDRLTRDDARESGGNDAGDGSGLLQEVAALRLAGHVLRCVRHDAPDHIPFRLRRRGARPLTRDRPPSVPSWDKRRPISRSGRRRPSGRRSCTGYLRAGAGAAPGWRTPSRCVRATCRTRGPSARRGSS